MEEWCWSKSIRSTSQKCSSIVNTRVNIFRWSCIGSSRFNPSILSISCLRTSNIECFQCCCLEVEKKTLIQISTTFLFFSEITSKEFLAALPAKRLTPQKLRCSNDLARGLLMQIPGLSIPSFVLLIFWDFCSNRKPTDSIESHCQWHFNDMQ